MSHDHDIERLGHELERLRRDVRKLRELELASYRFAIWSARATFHHIHTTETRIMSAISDFASKQAQFNSRLGAAIDGVAADVASLNAKIEEIQNTPGAISPEDQALLDELQAQGEAIAARLEAVDALTPPAVPG